MVSKNILMLDARNEDERVATIAPLPSFRAGAARPLQGLILGGSSILLSFP